MQGSQQRKFETNKLQIWKTRTDLEMPDLSVFI